MSVEVRQQVPARTEKGLAVAPHGEPSFPVVYGVRLLWQHGENACTRILRRKDHSLLSFVLSFFLFIVYLESYLKVSLY